MLKKGKNLIWLLVAGVVGAVTKDYWFPMVQKAYDKITKKK